MKTKVQKSPHQKMVDRLSRAEGQIRALKCHLETGTVDCQNFVSQIKAARSALKAVNEEYIITHLGTCQKLPPNEREKQMADAIRLLASD